MKVFWSYAKRDDPKPRRLTQLKEQFKNVLGQCKGMNIDVFQDESGLSWGVQWKKELQKEVISSDAFVCILTPSYFTSRMCIQEFIWAREERINIYPILYRECSQGLFSQFSETDPLNLPLNAESKNVEGYLKDYQYKDFSKLRNYEIDSKEVLDFLDGACNQLLILASK